MKRLALTTIALAVAVGAFAQGTIALNNRDTNAGGVVAYVFGVDPANPTVQKTGNTSSGLPVGGQTYGGTPLAGTGFSMSLLGGPSAGNLQWVGANAVFRTGSGAGLTANGSPTVMVPGVPAGSSAFLQAVAWDNKGGTLLTWDQALAAFNAGTTALGRSGIFQSRPLGGVNPSTGDIVLPPTALYGMEGFNLTQVPEPSVIALGILGGIGTLVLIRRRK